MTVADFIGTTIEFELIDLSAQRVTETLQSRLVLGPEGIHVFLEFYAEEKNENTEVWEESKYYYSRTYILRNNITGITRRWDNINNCWLIKVYSGDGLPYECYVKMEKRAEEIRQQLEDWLTPKSL